MEIMTVKFLGVSLISLSSQDILKLIESKIEHREVLTVCYLDDKQMSRALFSSKLKDKLNKFDVVIPRGAFLTRLIRSVYPDYPYKDEDCLDLLSPIFEKYKATNNNFMVFGSSQIGMNKLGMNLQASFVGLKLIGCYSDSFVKARTDAVREMIRKGDVRVIYLGVGTPFDEDWVIQNQDILNHSVSICVNKDIDILTGEVKEIPLKYRKTGKEYQYLLSRNWFRIFAIFRFALLKINTLLFKWRLKKTLGK